MATMKAQNLEVGMQYKEKRMSMIVEVIEIISRTDKAITIYTKSVSESKTGYHQFKRSFERKRNNTLLEIK